LPVHILAVVGVVTNNMERFYSMDLRSGIVNHFKISVHVGDNTNMGGKNHQQFSPILVLSPTSWDVFEAGIYAAASNTILTYRYLLVTTPTRAETRVVFYSDGSQPPSL